MYKSFKRNARHTAIQMLLDSLHLLHTGKKAKRKAFHTDIDMLQGFSARMLELTEKLIKFIKNGS